MWRQGNYGWLCGENRLEVYLAKQRRCAGVGWPEYADVGETAFAELPDFEEAFIRVDDPVSANRSQ